MTAPATLRQRVLHLIFAFRDHAPDNAVTPREAVTSFLGTMAANAGNTCGVWNQQLEGALADYLSVDARAAFFDHYPVEDFYFAGVVALEAAKLRQLYTPEEADELLAEIGEQIDRAAGRHDRMMSDLVFGLIGRIEMGTTPSVQKMPYDRVTKALLRQLDLHRNEATRELLGDKAFRLALGEPLATGMQNWWQAFKAKFVLYVSPKAEPKEPAFVPPAPVAAPVRRRHVRRAPSLIA